MALFDENVTIVPQRRQRPRATVVGIWAVTVALFALLALTLLPTPFVIQQPGPVYDTLGTASDRNGGQTPLITVAGAQTYPTEGELDLLTVQVVGNREHTPSWFELATAWFDPSRAVIPVEEIYPEGVTTEQRDEQSAAMMVDSQQEATAAALLELGYDVPSVVTVVEVLDGSAAQGVLLPEDIIVAAEGTVIDQTSRLRDIINAGDGAPVALTVLRGVDTLEVEVTPREGTVDGQSVWLIGISTRQDYDFPVDVTLRIDDVGGPSAGMMFALGIIDTLTEEQLTGGEIIAGTGTIDAAGTVGPIGGIRQKLYGADGAGADYFLAPESNCAEVVGHVPDGVRVFAVATLDDALDALAAVRDGADLDALPTCSS
ncbi:PDZ domain-containing protein [Microbacterium sp.]|uniref:YlbL family protein n=1 Tax=Microbacterium sp. TaxID=51671 RepID=UPI003A877BB0